MNWTNLGIFTDIAATLAVFATLVYLSIQVRTSNKQAELEGLRHTFDGFNQWCDLIVGSKETARILNLGRDGLDNLDCVERTQFEHLYIRFLNTVEGWYRQVDQTSRDAHYRETQLGNIASAVQGWLGHPGSREVWESYKLDFPLVANFVDESLDAVTPAEVAQSEVAQTE